MGAAPRIRRLRAREEAIHSYADHANLKRMFSVPRAVTLDEGLARMVEWAKHVGPRSRSRFGAIELVQHLPDSWAELIGREDL